MSGAVHNIGPFLDLNKIAESDEVQTVFNPLSELEKSWIDPTIEINKPPTILEIAGIPTLTAGNISAVIGKAKSKKTRFMVCLLSAVSSGKWGSMEGRRTEKVVLWFDTEQSQYHASQIVKLCHQLGAGNIKAYTLRGYNPAQRVKIIEAAIYNTENLGFVAIDGQRDLLTKGINDEEEATEITSKFLKWTAELDIHICLVLHTNKGDNNARGHIGTELINKSECVISIAKSEQDDTISIVSPEFSRNMDFAPFAFKLDPETSLPFICDLPETTSGKGSKKPYAIDDQSHFDVLNLIFRRKPKWKYAELWQIIQTEWGKKGLSFGIGVSKEYLSLYKSKEWIVQKDGIEYAYTRAIF